MARRPPWMWRCPRKEPLSRLKGARPAREAAWFLEREPNSGKAARRAEAETVPRPRTAVRAASLARRREQLLMMRAMVRSREAIWRLQKAMAWR